MTRLRDTDRATAITSRVPSTRRSRSSSTATINAPTAGRPMTFFSAHRPSVRQETTLRVPQLPAAEMRPQASSPPRRRRLPTRKASSGRCTTCCTRTSTRSISIACSAMRARSRSTSTALHEDIQAHRYLQRIKDDFMGGVRSGVNGTPSSSSTACATMDGGTCRICRERSRPQVARACTRTNFVPAPELACPARSERLARGPTRQTADRPRHAQ